MNHKLITNQTSLKQTSLAQGLAICMLTRSLGTNFPAPVLHHPQGTNVGRRALDRVSHHLGAPRLQAPSRSRRATFTNGHIIYGPLKLPFCRKNAPKKKWTHVHRAAMRCFFLLRHPHACFRHPHAIRQGANSSRSLRFAGSSIGSMLLMRLRVCHFLSIMIAPPKFICTHKF
jgi:hypothetical protein